MVQIKATATFKIKEGNLEAFKQVIPTIIETVRENDPGTLIYEWYLDEELMECVVLEIYANSEAVLAHAGNVGGHLQKLLELADFSLELYGNPSKELLDAIQGMNVTVYPLFAGL